VHVVRGGGKCAIGTLPVDRYDRQVPKKEEAAFTAASFNLYQSG
jgi:hypothetical protein